MVAGSNLSLGLLNFRLGASGPACTRARFLRGGIRASRIRQATLRLVGTQAARATTPDPLSPNPSSGKMGGQGGGPGGPESLPMSVSHGGSGGGKAGGSVGLGKGSRRASPKRDDRKPSS